jgi:hypothetical protein
MADARALTVLRVTHMVVFAVMASSAFALFYAGLTGATGVWLRIAMVLLGVEVVSFVGAGMRCPLSALALRWGAREGHAFDLFLSEKFTRYSFRFFGALMATGFFLLGLRYTDVIG